MGVGGMRWRLSVRGWRVRLELARRHSFYNVPGRAREYTVGPIMRIFRPFHSTMVNPVDPALPPTAPTPQIPREFTQQDEVPQ